MPLDVISVLSLFSLTIIIGYIGSLIFKRTGISDVIWLLILGILIGPIFNLVNRDLFLSVLPLLSPLALMFILFDAGLNMDFYQMIRGFSRSIVLSIVGIIISMVTVGIAAIFLLKFDLINGLLLGSIIGGTSSATVLSIVNRLQARPQTKTVLGLESILSDPFVVVIPIALIGIIMPSTGAVSSPVSSILSAFSIGAVIGLLGGLIWHFILIKLKEKSLEYIITIAALFLIFVFVETFSGSGAIAALMFGLVLGNRRTFSSILKITKRFKDDPGIITVHTEVTFFIRSFFFVFLGLIVTVTLQSIIFGMIIIGVLIGGRLIAVELSTLRMRISENEKNIMRIMLPRGLAAAVMSQIIVTQGLPNADIYTNIAFVVILGTTIFTTISSKFFFRRPRVMVEQSNHRSQKSKTKKAAKKNK